MRKILFWSHLVCGVTAAIVILMMSVTGVLLTYERQIIAWANSKYDLTVIPQTPRHSIEDIIRAAEQARPGKTARTIVLSADTHAAARVVFGREGTLYINPYTLESLGEGAKGVQNFFTQITSWHRWFNAGEGWFDIARGITGAANLIFLFLIISGMYLWLPRIYNWARFRHVLFFSRRALKNSKTRDYNWHHVLGIWSAIPLAVVVATAVVFSYPWANRLVYRVVGEQPPSRDARTKTAVISEIKVADGTPLSLEQLYQKASQHLDQWNRITLQIPADQQAPVRFTIDQGDGGQPQKRHTLKLGRHDGAVVSWEPFSSQSAGQRLRSYIRFLHTGEALGWVGQTIAGIVTFASILMVWTGIALSYRRLVRPLFRRNKHS